MMRPCCMARVSRSALQHSSCAAHAAGASWRRRCDRLQSEREWSWSAPFCLRRSPARFRPDPIKGQNRPRVVAQSATKTKTKSATISLSHTPLACTTYGGAMELERDAVSDASFGRWLRRRRKALDLTQDALAEQVGCSVATIRKIESDARRPSRQIAELLADVLAIPLDERPLFLQVARGERVTERLA